MSVDSGLVVSVGPSALFIETFSCDKNFDLHRKSSACAPPDCGGKLLPRENEYGTVVWTGAPGDFDRSTLRKQL